MSEFDKALLLRDRALRQASAAAPEDWKLAVRTAIRYVAVRQQEFTSEDVLERLRNLDVPMPDEKRALGALMLSAARDGLVSRTGRVRPYRSRSRHGGTSQIWASNVYNSELVRFETKMMGRRPA